MTLNNCLGRSVKLTKNADPDKYKQLWHKIWFSFKIFIFRWTHGKKWYYFWSYNISHKLLRPTHLLETFLEILEWSTFQKQIKPLPPNQCCSILAEWQHRSLRQEKSQILANNIGNGEGGLFSEFMSGIVVCAFW